VEVIEAVTGVRALAAHTSAFHEGDHDLAKDVPAARAAGKCVYYAPRDLTFPSIETSFARVGVSHADVPLAGTCIGRGAPVLTLLASGATAAECLALMKQRVEELDRALTR
jgi:predicted ATP-grasp superfamily ATP-dependent carboligase